MKQPLLFVPYHIALLAKQKGFNEPCVAKIFSEDDNPELGQIFTSSEIEKLSNNPNFVAAPTYQQLVDWLREKHLTFVFVLPTGIASTAVDYTGCTMSNKEHTDTKVFSYYYEAFDYTLERVLKEL